MALLDAPNRFRTELRATTGQHSGPNDSIRRIALMGWLIIAAFFGGLGTWAVMAPLNGAVIANAVIKIDGNRKSVQHLDGGIVQELHVREGEHVDGAWRVGRHSGLPERERNWRKTWVLCQLRHSVAA